jgi:arylsulfatase A-like enzyme
MNRRDFMRLAGAGTAAAVMGGFSNGRNGLFGKDCKDKPNIIFIMSDDHAASAISAYGGFLAEVAPTPNIDRLAKEGIRFDNCFCTNSICTPSRAAILTGKYSHKNGVKTLDDIFDGSQQTFPKLLQRAGYYTGVVGKWHLKTEPTGFNYYNVLPGQGDYFDPILKEKGKPWRDGYEGEVMHKGYVTDVITDLALDFLEKRPRDRPFCLLYHHKAPHDEWGYDAKHSQLFNDVEIPEPANLFDSHTHRGIAIKRCTQKIGRNHTLYEDETNHLSGRERKKKQYQIYIKSYLRCVASVDDNVGRVLDYLDESGLTENTIVVYTSDQGFFLGEHGLYDKRFMYEESLRMPLLVRYPRVIEPKSVSDSIVLNVDFAETFLDYAGLSMPPDMQGRSLRPLLGGAPKDWRSSMYYRYWMHRAHFNVAAHFGVRTKSHKLIYYYGLPIDAKGARPRPTRPEWELFDLEKDPMEMNNVYGKPAYAHIVEKLKNELLRLRKELEDEDEVVVI